MGETNIAKGVLTYYEEEKKISMLMYTSRGCM
jgi:hypothetical protein